METVTDPQCPSEPTTEGVLERAWGILSDEDRWYRGGGYVRRRVVKRDAPPVCIACMAGACGLAYVELKQGEMCDSESDEYAALDALSEVPTVAAINDLASVIETVDGGSLYGFSDHRADHEGVMQVFETALVRRGVTRPRPLLELP